MLSKHADTIFMHSSMCMAVTNDVAQTSYCYLQTWLLQSPSVQHTQDNLRHRVKQFFQNQSLWLFQSITQHSLNIPPHISVVKAHNNLQHWHKLSWHANFTISNNFILWFLTFFSSTCFRCCLKFGKISSIHSITGTFSTQWSAIPYFPEFPGNFAFSLTFPRQIKFPDILQFSLMHRNSTPRTIWPACCSGDFTSFQWGSGSHTSVNWQLNIFD